MTLALGVAPLAINRFLLNPALRSQALARAVLAAIAQAKAVLKQSGRRTIGRPPHGGLLFDCAWPA